MRKEMTERARSIFLALTNAAVPINSPESNYRRGVCKC